MPSLIQAAREVERFQNGPLKNRLMTLESAFEFANKRKCSQLCEGNDINEALLHSAYTIKRAAGQINVIIHALGILIALPRLLDKGERIITLSLGAGTAGKEFDLITNKRIAEFKFIQWQGRDAIRQNSLFKDFYALAEKKTSKKRFLCVTDATRPLKFFQGGRALNSVMSKNNKLWSDFQQRYGDRFSRVNENYGYRQKRVQIVDILDKVPELAHIFDGA